MRCLQTKVWSILGSACAAIMNAVAFIVALRERRLVCPEGTAWRGPVWFPPERSEKQSSIESMAASLFVVVSGFFILLVGLLYMKTLENSRNVNAECVVMVGWAI